jgi:hypothetical protein
MNRLMLAPVAVLPVALLGSETCEAGEHSLTYGGSWPEALIVITLLLVAARGVVNWLDRVSRFREK